MLPDATIIAVGAAFLVAGALAPLLARFAVGRNLLDVPNLRSSHEAPTPRLGGVAILAGVWVGVSLLSPEAAWPLLLAATLMWSVGLADDIFSLGFKTKAAAQLVLASALLLLYPPEVLSEAPGAGLKTLVFVVGVFWVAALSNAFNFMDGIDGITGGVAVISAVSLAAIVGEAGAYLPVLIGATLGFLVWNVSPASMFCGDSGSYFLGFGLAVVALYAPVPEGGWSPLGFFACAVVFTPYLFDTAYTIIRRLRSGAGKNIFSAHREHIYQRITPAVSMHRRTSNLYYGASVVAGFAALMVARGGALAVAGALLALGCCVGLAALPHLVGMKDRSE